MDLYDNISVLLGLQKKTGNNVVCSYNLSKWQWPTLFVIVTELSVVWYKSKMKS